MERGLAKGSSLLRPEAMSSGRHAASGARCAGRRNGQRAAGDGRPAAASASQVPLTHKRTVLLGVQVSIGFFSFSRTRKHTHAHLQEVRRQPVQVTTLHTFTVQHLDTH